MNLKINGHHLEVTPALHDYVTSKFQRIKRHSDQVMDARVILSVDNLKEKERRQHCECNVSLKGTEIHVESSHFDMYAAIDDMLDKLDRQIQKHKEKSQAHVAEAHKKMGD